MVARVSCKSSNFVTGFSRPRKSGNDNLCHGTIAEFRCKMVKFSYQNLLCWPFLLYFSGSVLLSLFTICGDTCPLSCVIPGHSPFTNLLATLNDWTRIVCNKHGVLVASIDFRKAFDCVLTVKLLTSFSQYDVCGVSLLWLQRFFSNRTCQTRLGTSLSFLLLKLRQSTTVKWVTCMRLEKKTFTAAQYVTYICRENG